MSHPQLIALSEDYAVCKRGHTGRVSCTICSGLIRKRSYYIFSKQGPEILCRRCALADPNRIADVVQTAR